MTGGLLVVGVGNAWRSDDGAGPAVARALGDDPRVLVHEGEPIGLIEAWAGADEVVVVDAVSSGAPAGTVPWLDPVATPLPGAFARGSTHVFGLVETLEHRAHARAPATADHRLRHRGRALLGAGDGLSPAVRAGSVADVHRELQERLEGR